MLVSENRICSAVQELLFRELKLFNITPDTVDYRIYTCTIRNNSWYHRQGADYFSKEIVVEVNIDYIGINCYAIESYGKLLASDIVWIDVENDTALTGQLRRVCEIVDYFMKSALNDGNYRRDSY